MTNPYMYRSHRNPLRERVFLPEREEMPGALPPECPASVSYQDTAGPVEWLRKRLRRHRETLGSGYSCRMEYFRTGGFVVIELSGPEITSDWVRQVEELVLGVPYRTFQYDIQCVPTYKGKYVPELKRRLLGQSVITYAYGPNWTIRALRGGGRGKNNWEALNHTEGYAKLDFQCVTMQEAISTIDRLEAVFS